MSVYIKKNINVRQFYDEFFLEKEICLSDTEDNTKIVTLRSNIYVLKIVSLLR